MSHLAAHAVNHSVHVREVATAQPLLLLVVPPEGEGGACGHT